MKYLIIYKKYLAALHWILVESSSSVVWVNFWSDSWTSRRFEVTFDLWKALNHALSALALVVTWWVVVSTIATRGVVVRTVVAREVFLGEIFRREIVLRDIVLRDIILWWIFLWRIVSGIIVLRWIVTGGIVAGQIGGVRWWIRGLIGLLVKFIQVAVILVITVRKEVIMNLISIKLIPLSQT